MGDTIKRKQTFEQNAAIDRLKDQGAPGGIKKMYTSRRFQNSFDEKESDESDDSLMDEETAAIEWFDSKGETRSLPANDFLAKHKNLFRDVVKTESIITDNPLVTMMISFDSKRAISVQCEDE